MGRRWVEPALMVVAGLSVIGAVRSVVVVVTPPGAQLPEPLQSMGPRLGGFESRRETSKPSRRELDLAWGPAHRYRLVPAKGDPVLLELVVRRSRAVENMALPELKGAKVWKLKPNQQVMVGRAEGRERLQSCLVGRGAGEREPAALAEEKALSQAVARWRQRLDRPDDKITRWKRIAVMEAGLAGREGWDCLLVTLTVDKTLSPGSTGSVEELLAAWQELLPQLQRWGEK